MDINTPADKIRASLGLDVSTPPFAVTAAGLMNPTTGALGAKVDSAGRLIQTYGGQSKTIAENFTNYDTTDQIAILTATGLVRATTANLLHHIYSPGGFVYGNANLGTQTTAPSIVAAGLEIGGVATDDIGTEIFTHFAGASGAPFVVGNDAGFFFRVSITIADVSGTDTFIAGFRRAEVNNGTLASYADYIGIGFNTAADPAAIKLISEVNGSAPASYPVDTTQTWADAATKVLQVNVSAGGAVTFLINGAAPTATEAATLDNGDPMIPFVHILNSTDLMGSVTINSWEVGYL